MLPVRPAGTRTSSALFRPVHWSRLPPPQEFTSRLVTLVRRLQKSTSVLVASRPNGLVLSPPAAAWLPLDGNSVRFFRQRKKAAAAERPVYWSNPAPCPEHHQSTGHLGQRRRKGHESTGQIVSALTTRHRCAGRLQPRLPSVSPVYWSSQPPRTRDQSTWSLLARSRANANLRSPVLGHWQK